MNDKEILANAPEGATYYSKEQNQHWAWHERKPFFNGEMTIDYPDDLRSLADIRALVEKDERIKGLEKERDALLNVTNQIKGIAFDASLTDHDTMVTKLLCVLNGNLDLVSNANSRNVAKALEAHSLEQQAKGIEDLAEMMFTGGSISTTGYDMAFDYADKLREGVTNE